VKGAATVNGSEPLALDYFSGGVPAGAVFWNVLDDIRKISAQFADPERGTCKEFRIFWIQRCWQRPFDQRFESPQNRLFR
jgi:hypothetical protein